MTNDEIRRALNTCRIGFGYGHLAPSRFHSLSDKGLCDATVTSLDVNVAPNGYTHYHVGLGTTHITPAGRRWLKEHGK